MPQARGIKTGDIVKIFNERGIVLGGALVWERIMPGVTYMDHGARCDAILPGKIDRGGAIDLISPDWIISKNCVGEATSGFLVDVQKVTQAEMEEWKKALSRCLGRENTIRLPVCASTPGLLKEENKLKVFTS